MKQNPWSGRFDQPPDKAFLAFSSSLNEDRLLIREDVIGSLAHAASLRDAGILSEKEHEEIRAGLRAVLSDLESGKAQLREELEDVHMNVETLLGARTTAAGKLHTARSRNDQVALDMRLFARRALLTLADELVRYADALLSKAAKHADLVMPGYTHLQPAMPITFGHLLHAHAERALRDAARAMDAFARANVSPLGAAALAGTSYAIEPRATAERLGFDAAFSNSLDAVSDRDFVAEALFVSALTATHLSGLGEELVLWSSPAYGFVRLSEDLTTGSSIMPQKRNPDAAELLRGRSGRNLGALVAVLSTLKSLPLAYNRDLQEAKGPLVAALPYCIASVRMSRALVEGLNPVPEKMAAHLSQGHLEATELADILAQGGTPFREAHHIVGALVKEAEHTGKSLAELARARGIDAPLPADVPARKTSPGGTAPERVREQVKAAQRAAKELGSVVRERTERVERAERALLAQA